MLNAFLTPTRSFSIVATRLSQCNIINSLLSTLERHSLSLFCFIYLYILYLFCLFLYSSHLLFIINLLLFLIILGFWGVLVFWVWVCLGLGLVGQGWLKALVLLGRAWVISLPKFFVGNSFQFWKLPPLFCINNRDNVYYPVFLTCYII